MHTCHYCLDQPGGQQATWSICGVGQARWNHCCVWAPQALYEGEVIYHVCIMHACNFSLICLIKFQKSTWFRKRFTLAFTLRWQLAKTIAGWQEPIVVSEWKKGDTSPYWFCVLWSISCWFQRWLEGIFTWIAGVLNTSKLILSSRDNIFWIGIHACTLKPSSFTITIYIYYI